jgi:hypothetical protein
MPSAVQRAGSCVDGALHGGMRPPCAQWRFRLHRPRDASSGRVPDPAAGWPNKPSRRPFSCASGTSRYTSGRRIGLAGTTVRIPGKIVIWRSFVTDVSAESRPSRGALLYSHRDKVPAAHRFLRNRPALEAWNQPRPGLELMENQRLIQTRCRAGPRSSVAGGSSRASRISHRRWQLIKRGPILGTQVPGSAERLTGFVASKLAKLLGGSKAPANNDPSRLSASDSSHRIRQPSRLSPWLSCPRAPAPGCGYRQCGDRLAGNGGARF